MARIDEPADNDDSLEEVQDVQRQRGRDGVASLRDVEAESGDEEALVDGYDMDDKEAREAGINLDDRDEPEPRLD